MGQDIQTHAHALPFLVQGRNGSIPGVRAPVHLLPCLLDTSEERPVSLSPSALHWGESDPREVEGEEVLRIPWRFPCYSPTFSAWVCFISFVCLVQCEPPRVILAPCWREGTRASIAPPYQHTQRLWP